MYEDLKKEIKEARKNNEELTDEQTNRLIAAIKSGDYNNEGLDTVCCKYRQGPVTQYDKTDRDTCLNVLFGEVVSDENCG